MRTLSLLLLVLISTASLQAMNIGNKELSNAAEFNKPVVLKVLLALGFDPNKKLDGSTPLHRIAIYNRDRDATTAKILQEHGAELNVLDNLGNTPLHLAVQWHNIPVVKFLLVHGAHVNLQNNEGKTPLHMAFGHFLCHGKSIELISLLLLYGANVNITDTSGNTLLTSAAQYEIPKNRYTVSKQLLDTWYQLHTTTTLAITSHNPSDLFRHAIRALILQHHTPIVTAFVIAKRCGDQEIIADLKKISGKAQLHFAIAYLKEKYFSKSL